MFNSGSFGLDIGALLGNMLGRNGGNGGFGDGNGWWVLIILFALFSGWGRNGNGFGNNDGGNGGSSTVVPYPVYTSGFGCSGGGSGSGFVSAEIQRGFDNQSVINKLNGLENGICSLGYDQLSQMNNLGTTVMQTGYSIRDAVLGGFNNSNVVALQNQNATQAQIQSCCCGLEKQLATAEYNRAADTCAITTAIRDAARDIIQNDNCNYRQLHDEQIAIQMQQKDAQIAQLQRQLSTCDAQSIASQAVASAVQQIVPKAGPAWIVPNPNGCQCNQGWGPFGGNYFFSNVA